MPNVHSRMSCAFSVHYDYSIWCFNNFIYIYEYAYACACNGQWGIQTTQHTFSTSERQRLNETSSVNTSMCVCVSAAGRHSLSDVFIMWIHEMLLRLLIHQNDDDDDWRGHTAQELNSGSAISNFQKHYANAMRDRFVHLKPSTRFCIAPHSCTIFVYNIDVGSW